MQFEGRVKELMPVQSGTSQKTGEPWKNQQFVFGFYESSDAIYEREVILKLRNDKVDLYKLQVGDKIKAKFSIGINTWEGKKYNEVYTGDIEILQRANQQQAPAPQQQQQGVATNGDPSVTGPQGEQQPVQGDDLPF